jgi:uncharacterized membrane protein
MATTTATRRRKPPARKGPAKPVAKATRKVAKPVAKAAGKTAAKTAAKAAKHTVAEAVPRPSWHMARLAVRAIERLGATALSRARQRRLPIQRSVDVAVPLGVAWEEWMQLEALPEGVHTVTGIERDGSNLIADGDWEAEILDERPRQSFAWQSYGAGDCAGLVTFHELAPRLTRIELNLDVVPTTVAETALLASRVADRRTETELRRLKARLELINPDLYENDNENQDEDEPAETAEDNRNGG